MSQELLRRITIANDASIPINDFIEDWMSKPLSISPWGTWTLFSLVHHRRRQQFVAEIVKNRLGVNLEDLARSGYDAHPKGKGQGLVPDLTEWKYDLHGIGCCVTHRVTGEEIDVDFFDDTSDWFAQCFYQDYLSALQTPEVWEKHVIDLHPTFNISRGKFETVDLAFDELRELGLLEQHTVKRVVRLAFDDLDLFEQITQFEASPDQNKRLIRLAAVVSDWPLVKNLLELEQATPLIEEAATQIIAARELKLTRLFHQGMDQNLALKALRENNSPDLDEYIKQTLSDESSNAISSALEMITTFDDSAWCPIIDDFVNRFDPAGKVHVGEFPEPEIWGQCIDFMLRHNYQFDETSKYLHIAHKYCLADAAFLALKYQLPNALELFRMALRSEIPRNREIASAILAILDQPWSRRELLQVLKESTTQHAAAECRAALQQLQSKDAHQLVNEWEELNPHEPETGDCISLDEMLVLRVPGYVKWEIEDWYDRVLPLRTVVPQGSEVKW